MQGKWNEKALTTSNYRGSRQSHDEFHKTCRGSTRQELFPQIGERKPQKAERWFG
jgi:hypothetical protein